MNVEFQLILLQVGIHFDRPFQQALPQIFQPGDMLLLQVAQAPDISSLHQRQQMQGSHRLPIPIQIRQHQEPIFRAMPGIPQNHIFLLRPALKNVEHPVQPAFFALGAHVGSYVIAVDFRCLRHHTYGLRRVLLNVLLRTWPDEVDLQVVRVCARLRWCDSNSVATTISPATVPIPGRREVPAVNIIVTEVLDASYCCVERSKDLE